MRLHQVTAIQIRMKKSKKGQVALEALMVIVLILIAISIFYGFLSTEKFSVDALYTTRLEAQHIATAMTLSLGNEYARTTSVGLDYRYKYGYSTVIKVEHQKNQTSTDVVAISEKCDEFLTELSIRLEKAGLDTPKWRCFAPYKAEYCNEYGICTYV